MRQLTSPHKPPFARPPSAASPLTPSASGCINAETRQASSWQQLGFRSELFLSQTVKLVKIFHVLLKPLTISSFFPLDVLGISPAPPPQAPSSQCHPTPLCLCPSLYCRPVPHVIEGNVVPISHVGNSLSLQPLLALLPPLQPPSPLCL